MAAEIKKEIQLEIAHVLFIDIVGYSKLSINEQHAAVEELNRIVRASEQFQRAEAANRLLKIPTGDGMALVFYTSPEAPAQCAVEVSRILKEHPRLQLRMGVHSGPVSGVIDVNGHANLAGAGLNTAQRVMACGDAGHILVSKHVAEDIEDEILTRLSKIADLKVISRTSTQLYQSKPRNLREIAKQLGVAHIVEGSVQKSGDSVRVNVQLIKAANDSHLWADTFDRKLTDIFSVESEVAKSIAERLRAKLTGQEEQVIAAKPTDNPEAYDAYLRGLAYTLKAGLIPANSLGAQTYLKEAVRLDSKFAIAWARLSYTDARGYITATLQPTVALREEARQSAE